MKQIVIMAVQFAVIVWIGSEFLNDNPDQPVGYAIIVGVLLVWFVGWFGAKVSDLLLALNRKLSRRRAGKGRPRHHQASKFLRRHDE